MSSVNDMTTTPAPALAAPVRMLRQIGIDTQYVLLGFPIGILTVSLLTTLFWTGVGTLVIWVGLPILAVLVGNGWRSFSPFRTLYRLLDRAALAAGIGRLALHLPYPAGLARWPAVVLLFIAIWAELVLPGSSNASTVGLLLAGYTLVTIGGLARTSDPGLGAVLAGLRTELSKGR